MRAALLAFVSACALTSKSAPLELRYFAPPVHPVTAAERTTVPTPLRLGRIVPSALLRSRIVYRESPVEVSPYETLRWTDEPDAYVRRSLSRALYDGQPLQQAVGGTAPALDVDVLAFEEVRRGSQRFGRVELRYRVHDDQRVIAHGTVAVERPATAGIEGVVAAIGDALDIATADLAGRVAAAVCP
jgi:ABC-type uncharacterized transport system auxiliary subunit